MRNTKLGREERKRVNDFVKEYHTMVVEYNELDKIFCISFPELPECYAKGKDIKEALRNVESAKWTWGVACIINEHDLPKSRTKRIDEQYIFVRLKENELYEINRRAWERKKSPSKYVESLITKRILLFELEIKPSKIKAVKDIWEAEEMDMPKSFQTDKIKAGASQVAFAG